MSKWLKRSKAARCPIHRALKETAKDFLENDGYFSKEQVLKKLGFESIGDSVRWDYIREFIQAEQEQCELVPLASVFFKRRSKDMLEANPAKYIASGHGKKTFGYASVSEEANAKLVIKRIEQRREITNGVAKKFVAYVDAVKKQLPQPVLEQLEEKEAKLLTNQGYAPRSERT